MAVSSPLYFLLAKGPLLLFIVESLPMKQFEDWRGAYESNASRTLLSKAFRVNGF